MPGLSNTHKVGIKGSDFWGLSKLEAIRSITAVLPCQVAVKVSVVVSFTIDWDASKSADRGKQTWLCDGSGGRLETQGTAACIRRHTQAYAGSACWDRRSDPTPWLDRDRNDGELA